MISSLIHLSIRNKLVVFLFTAGLIGFGTYALYNISIGAVPDITNNQVQVITTSRNLSTEDVEKFLTYPVELEMANLPGVVEIRSISKFGLSVVTIVFEENMGTYLPRQLIAEKIKSAAESIPDGFGSPEMGPVSTGLGEIYQYILDVKPEFKDRYTVMELRSIQDWIVKRHLSGISGVVEINTWGGYLKTYEVAIDPIQLQSMEISLMQVYEALEQNNSIAGGGYIEKTNESFFIRSEGLISTIDDIKNIVVDNRDGIPILIDDVAEVGFGHANRFGAITGNGEGEKILGQIMMLKGASSKEVINNVKLRIEEIQPSLPEGVFINPILERSELVERTTSTIVENLVLGCLIVIFIVIFLLGNLRSGLVVASVIPLCLLFAISMMHLLGIDANLMSLGAIDFGIIIDGAVIIVEFIAFRITQESQHLLSLSKNERRSMMDKITAESTSKMMHSAVFGQLIIIIVFIPILTLVGIEGKMFRPMAQTFCLALIGAMILCFTYVPVMSALFIRPSKNTDKNISAKIIKFIKRSYQPILRQALNFRYTVLSLAIILLILTGFIFKNMGSEFIPTLDEGDFVIQPVLKTGMSLSKTIEITSHIERILRRLPEVKQVVSRIGAAEVPTDPMSMEESDIIITLHPPSQWKSARTKDALAEVFQKAIEKEIPKIELEFTQPIEMRFNELISGVQSDVAIKLYGENLDILQEKVIEIKNAISSIEGAVDITFERTAGLPQMKVKFDRHAIAKYGLNIDALNRIITAGFAGLSTGIVYEGERQFDLVVRYKEELRNSLNAIKNSMVSLPDGTQLPLSTFANIYHSTGPAMISRDNTKRRSLVGLNVRGRDLQSVVNDIRHTINHDVTLPPGYYIEYGGQFENLESASRRLMMAVPVSLLLIFVLLYFAFRSISETTIVFTAIPLSAVGGIILLYLRDMPFSISAGVGFIALFGIAVLNGIVLIEHYKELKLLHPQVDVYQRVLQGTTDRLRPVLLTATAAALGFLPMAMSASAGAEVQRPLATVVIGGLITATILTLIILPILYTMLEKSNLKYSKGSIPTIVLALIILLPTISNAQNESTLEEVISAAIDNSLELQTDQIRIQRVENSIDANKEVDKANLFYSYDRNNTPDIGPALHVIGASQSFKMPGYYKAIDNAGKENIRLQENQRAITENYIVRDVSSIYYSILHWNSLIQEYIYLDSLYSSFQSVSNRKYELGESNLLQKITAEAKRNEVVLKLEEAKRNRILASTQLKQITRDTAILIPTSKANKIITLKETDNLNTVRNYRTQEIEVAKSKKTLTEKRKLPELNLTIFNGINSFNNFELYPGIEAGVSVPIWKKSYEAKTIDAQLEIEIKENQLKEFEYNLQTAMLQLKDELAIYKSAIDQYLNSGVNIESQLISTASKSWKGGEIDFFQYIQSLENAAIIRINYLHQLEQYNQTIIKLQYLLN